MKNTLEALEISLEEAGEKLVEARDAVLRAYKYRGLAITELEKASRKRDDLIDELDRLYPDYSWATYVEKLNQVEAELKRQRRAKDEIECQIRRARNCAFGSSRGDDDERSFYERKARQAEDELRGVLRKIKQLEEVLASEKRNNSSLSAEVEARLTEARHSVSDTAVSTMIIIRIAFSAKRPLSLISATW